MELSNSQIEVLLKLSEPFSKEDEKHPSGFYDPAIEKVLIKSSLAERYFHESNPFFPFLRLTDRGLKIVESE